MSWALSVGELGNPSACDIGRRLVFMHRDELQCELWVEYACLGSGFWYALQLKRKPGRASTRKESPSAIDEIRGCRTL